MSAKTMFAAVVSIAAGLFAAGRLPGVATSANQPGPADTARATPATQQAPADVVFTNGDVYTSAAGNPANNGLSTSAPKDSIMGILNAYDTESRDVIYVDTGVYGVTSDVRVIWSRGDDDVYGELYFGERRPAPAKAYDTQGLVLHCASFSKTLAPGYRVGWTLAG